MPRLTKEDWAVVRARYEVEGCSLYVLAKDYDITISALSRRASKDSWEQGKSRSLVDKKVEAIAMLADVEEEKSTLLPESRRLVDHLARKELEAQDIGADLKKAILAKSKTILQIVDEPSQLLTLAKTHSELLKQSTPQNQIAVVNGGGNNEKPDGPKLELILNPPPDGRRTK